jgi:hypothetical protein
VDFVVVVDQAIALLRRRCRLTYRTLQLQFQLDAEHLEAHEALGTTLFYLGTRLAHTNVRSGRFSEHARSRAYRLL